MNKILKPKKVLLLGSGGLKIGQAGEFDYSGSQAIKAYKEEGIQVVLHNPNIATVQTDKNIADKIYFLPLTLEYAEQIIKDEKPDYIALSFGGQTALNLGLELEEKKILKKYGIKVLGTSTEAIRLTEDRKLFANMLHKIGVHTAKSIATNTVSEAREAGKKIGYPIMMRSGFALGGEGSGRVESEEELIQRTTEVFKHVKQILIEEYLAGWKEVEYEVVRDVNDNCITVCNMENLDPMGIHTGESIVVAPSQTLNNYEYHMLREVAIKTIKHIGIVGECNIQYALNPDTHEYRVIEVNARLSRSSALASKATGYPLAYIVAKLSLHHSLTELKNNITGKTYSCFEPALDYIVMKMPRWDLNKFKGAENRIGTEMKSVGEVMSIGRSFEEVLQKAIRSLNIGKSGFVQNGEDLEKSFEQIKNPTNTRIFALANVLHSDNTNKTVEKIYNLSKIDKWFLYKMQNIVRVEKEILKIKNFKKLERNILQLAKKTGFSDRQIAKLINSTEEKVRDVRKKLKVLPVVKQIDTLAGEFPTETNYLYLTYHGTEHDINFQKKTFKKQIAVLGSGPYCIGSSVEFDWSCVQVLNTLKKEKIGTIMINCNPETVSTDYNMSDKLYFEELSLERVLDICDLENPDGMVISTSGQIGNNLVVPLSKNKIKILGTSSKDINIAEDRHLFSKLLDKINVSQPLWTEVNSIDSAVEKANQFGYPVLVRPSYVLSGSAMNVVYGDDSLKNSLSKAVEVSDKHKVVISKFIENAREIEIDGVAQNGDLIIYAISEHVENAGTHSGDATVVLPPQKTYLETVRVAKRIAKSILKELKVTGPFNIQFIAENNFLQVIECNVRASRSFPFVSKATGYNFIEIATEAMLGKDVSGDYKTLDLDRVAVKSPQFSYSRIKGADPVGYVEMNSTGEVACIDKSFRTALLQSMQAAGFKLPRNTKDKNASILVSLGKEENKVKLLESIKILHDKGFNLYATEHTADFLNDKGIKCEKVYKIHTGEKPNVLGLIESGKLDLIINVPNRYLARDSQDGFVIRRKAVDNNIPLLTNRQLIEAFAQAIKS